MSSDDKTFKVNFTGEGAIRLQDAVRDKLKEFMGDYTDDTLVEYVIVLLRNGRRKEEAGKELNVFLGDDSISFVSWLWDHLSSCLHLYIQTTDSSPDNEIKKSIFGGHSGKHSLQLDDTNNNFRQDSDYETEKPINFSRIRHNREWKGLVRDETEPVLLRSTLVDDSRSSEKPFHRRSPVRRSPPKPQLGKKRSRQDEQTTKREVVSRPMLDAPRRLLQFAVRDAVRTVQQTASKSEPALKRLRSVVSTSLTNSHVDGPPQRPKLVARLPGAVATAIKAAAEAAEDVVKAKSSANVFDRLGHGSDRPEVNNPSLVFRENISEDGDDEDFDQFSKQLGYQQKCEYEGGSAGDVTMVERSTGLASDSGSDFDGDVDVHNLRSRVAEASQSASSAPKDKNSLMVQYSVSQNANEIVRNTRLKDQEPPVTAATNGSRKIVNISVNVNTWKPPDYQVSREITEVKNPMVVERSEMDGGKLLARLPKGNDTATASNNNEQIIPEDAQKDIQKPLSTHGSYSSGRPSEDADSRTIFVNNVHFAATKDTLSRHFNKFGEVLKVVIVTDAATGQPKGSAYVEFLRKGSAELALSLNGTSFMSRILKVVRRSAAHQETAAMMSWPRIARAAPFAPRLGRTPYPRGIMANSFRGRLPVKPGARSLQWKRGDSSSPVIDSTKNIQNTAAPGSSLISPSGRNLTYVRSETKPDCNLGIA